MTGFDGHQLYTDNYYTSTEVYLELYKRGINCCGTVCTNKLGFPKELIKWDKLAAAWFDQRYLYFLSTMHVGASCGDMVKRQNPDGTLTNVPCPPLLPHYQQCMRGLDREDQLVGCYNIGWRSKKWWKKYFHILLNVHCWMLTCSRNMLNQHCMIPYSGEEKSRFFRLPLWCGWTADRITCIMPPKWLSFSTWQYDTSMTMQI